MGFDVISSLLKQEDMLRSMGFSHSGRYNRAQTARQNLAQYTGQDLPGVEQKLMVGPDGNLVPDNTLAENAALDSNAPAGEQVKYGESSYEHREELKKFWSTARGMIVSKVAKWSGIGTAIDIATARGLPVPQFMFGPLPFFWVTDYSVGLSDRALKFRAKGDLFMAHQMGENQENALTLNGKVSGPLTYVFFGIMIALQSYMRSQVLPSEFENYMNSLATGHLPSEALIKSKAPQGGYHNTFTMLTPHYIFTGMYLETVSMWCFAETDLTLHFSLMFRKYKRPPKMLQFASGKFNVTFDTMQEQYATKRLPQLGSGRRFRKWADDYYVDTKNMVGSNIRTQTKVYPRTTNIAGFKIKWKEKITAFAWDIPLTHVDDYVNKKSEFLINVIRGSARIGMWLVGGFGGASKFDTFFNTMKNSLVGTFTGGNNYSLRMPNLENRKDNVQDYELLGNDITLVDHLLDESAFQYEKIDPELSKMIVFDGIRVDMMNESEYREYYEVAMQIEVEILKRSVMDFSFTNPETGLEESVTITFDMEYIRNVDRDGYEFEMPLISFTHGNYINEILEEGKIYQLFNLDENLKSESLVGFYATELETILSQASATGEGNYVGKTVLHFVVGKTIVYPSLRETEVAE